MCGEQGSPGELQRLVHAKFCFIEMSKISEGIGQRSFVALLLSEGGRFLEHTRGSQHERVMSLWQLRGEVLVGQSDADQAE